MGTFILYWLFPPHFLSWPFVGKPDMASCPSTRFTVEKLTHTFSFSFCRCLHLFVCFKSPLVLFRVLLTIDMCVHVRVGSHELADYWRLPHLIFNNQIQNYCNTVDICAKNNLSPLSCLETEFCTSWFRFLATAGLKEICIKRNTCFGHFA